MKEIADQPTQISVGKAVYSFETKLLTGSVGEEVVLRAKSLQVLEFLISRAGQVVSRDEILETVWTDLEVSDDSLTQCISGIRRAIEDNNRQTLQTIPKRGYLLNLPVTKSNKHNAIPPNALEGDKTPSRKASSIVYVETSAQNVTNLISQLDQPLKRINDIITDASGVFLRFHTADHALDCVFSMLNLKSYAVGVSYGSEHTKDEARFLAHLSAPGHVNISLAARDEAVTNTRFKFEDLGDKETDIENSAHAPKLRVFRVTRDALYNDLTLIQGGILPTLAILPLQNGMGGNDSGVLGRLFSNTLTHELSRSHEVNVISNMSTVAFSQADLGLQSVRDHLKADFVLSGFWTELDGTIRFDYEFSDTCTQRLLWSDSVTTTQSDILNGFAACHTVVGQIRKAIVLNETLKINSQPLATLEAYSVLYGAIGLMHRLSPADFKSAKQLLDTLTLDRHHPTPLAWTARWHFLKVLQGWSDDPAAEGQFALDCTARALDIEPTHPLALVSEGQILTHIKRCLDDAADRYDTALEVNPNDANGRMSKAMHLAFVDRGSEGLADAQRSLKLSPLDPHRFLNLGMAAGVNLSAGNNDQAVELARASYKLNKTHTSTLRMLAVAEVRCGNSDQAGKAVSKLLKLQPSFRVSEWFKNSPSANFENGRQFASDLRSLGLPE